MAAVYLVFDPPSKGLFLATTDQARAVEAAQSIKGVLCVLPSMIDFQTPLEGGD